MSNGKVYQGSCFCDAVQITQGAENIRTYSKTPLSYRKWCTTCGGHVFTEHPTWGGHRRVCGSHSGLLLPGRHLCELWGDEAADTGQAAKNEGPAKRNGRLRRQHPGISLSGLQSIRKKEHVPGVFSGPPTYRLCSTCTNACRYADTQCEPFPLALYRIRFVSVSV